MRSAPEHPLERLRDAMNRHDLDQLVACFTTDYRSEQPAHPARAFAGNAQVRRNWTTMFASMPDFHAEVVRSAAVGDTVWSEWRWVGTVRDGRQREMRGVIIYGTEGDRIAWGRLYMEPVEANGDDIDASLGDLRPTQ